MESLLIVRNKIRKRICLNTNNKLKLIVGTIYHLSKAFNNGQQITRQIEEIDTNLSGNRCWESQCRIDGCKWLQNIYYESKRNRVHCTKFVYHVKRIHKIFLEKMSTNSETEILIFEINDTFLASWRKKYDSLLTHSLKIIETVSLLVYLCFDFSKGKKCVKSIF